jgi:hypothetical protein
MRISFHLNDEEETHIFSLYEMKSNPFKKGDIVNLSVDDIISRASMMSAKMTKNHKEIREKFHLKEVLLKEERKCVTITFEGEDVLVIEYKCEIVEEK